MNRSDHLERTNLSTRALEFLLDLQEFDASQDESIGTLCVLAEELQPGAVVGGTIIDGRSATFDRALFPSLPASSVSTLRHSPIAPPYIGTCAQAVCEGRLVVCPDVATDTRFDAGWRRLYLGLGIQSVQSAPIFSFNGKALGTFVVAFRQPHASFDMHMVGFGVYAMRTILQKPSCYNSGPRAV
jgi:GAF domain-containing protein